MEFICKAAEKLWAELVGTDAEYDKNKAKGLATGMKITNVFLGFTGVETMAAGQRTIEGFFSGNGQRGKRKAEDGVRSGGSDKRRTPDPCDRAGSTALEAGISFHCPRCGQEIRRAMVGMDGPEGVLNALKTEHADFHYAQDLARESDGNVSPVSKRRKKGKAEAKGIARFFSSMSSKR